MESKLERAFRIANNAIYFDDNSDYCSALWDICMILKPQLSESEIGQVYIEEDEE